MPALVHRLTGHGGMREGRLGRLQKQMKVVEKAQGLSPNQQISGPPGFNHAMRAAHDIGGLSSRAGGSTRGTQPPPPFSHDKKFFLGCDWPMAADRAGGTGRAPSFSSSFVSVSSNRLSRLDALRK